MLLFKRRKNNKNLPISVIFVAPDFLFLKGTRHAYAVKCDLMFATPFLKLQGVKIGYRCSHNAGFRKETPHQLTYLLSRKSLNNEVIDLQGGSCMFSPEMVISNYRHPPAVEIKIVTLRAN